MHTTTTSATPIHIAYFDPVSGASGDMILGALLDAGLALDALTAALRSLPLPGWELTSEPVRRGALGASLARVRAAEQDLPHRRLADVLRIIDGGNLPGDAAAQARAIFTRLAEAEARVHRESIESIHFHEVGALDAIVDICGAAAGLALLEVQEVYCGPLPLASGSVETAHGTLPLPAPATLELLARAGASTIPHPATAELVTPTGAAILTTLARFERPAMRIRAAGYGAGSRSSPSPNVLRVVIGDRPNDALAGGEGEETLTMLECNIDDMNPQWYGYLFERLLDQGALDVTCAPVLMKKGRPGQILSVLCRPMAEASLTTLLLGETTTLGVRRYSVQRYAAQRIIHPVETSFGALQVKLRVIDGRITGATPEYETCLAVARERGRTLAEVTAAAQAAAYPLLHTELIDLAPS